MSMIRLSDHFAELTDPRRREVTYPLINVVVIAVCAVICGADDFVAIADWGRAKRDWLAKFLDLSAGIPSHDRFNAILAAGWPRFMVLHVSRCVSTRVDSLTIPIEAPTRFSHRHSFLPHTTEPTTISSPRRGGTDEIGEIYFLRVALAPPVSRFSLG